MTNINQVHIYLSQGEFHLFQEDACVLWCRVPRMYSIFCTYTYVVLTSKFHLNTLHAFNTFCARSLLLRYEMKLKSCSKYKKTSPYHLRQCNAIDPPYCFHLYTITLTALPHCQFVYIFWIDVSLNKAKCLDYDIVRLMAVIQKAKTKIVSP